MRSTRWRDGETVSGRTLLGPLLGGREIRGAVARPDGVLVVVDAASEELVLVSSTT